MTSIQAIRIVGGVMPPSLIAHLHDGKLLHAPLSQLKACRANGSLGYVDAARVLFDLDDEGRSRKPRPRPVAAAPLEDTEST